MEVRIVPLLNVYILCIILKAVHIMAETFVVVSKIKKAVKEKGLRTGGDYVDALSKKVEEIVNASVAKVQAENKKKTLGAEDL